MSDEYDNESFSPFWPLAILLTGLVIWSGYQVYAVNSQRSIYDQQFQGAVPTITQAQGISKKYVDLMKDLVETSAKDQYAAQIVKEATAAGWIHVQPNAGGTNATTTPTPPAK